MKPKKAKTLPALVAALVALPPGLTFAQAPAPIQTPAPAQLPIGGQVVAGTAGIAQAGVAMSITQTSQRAAIDWQSFNLGSRARVDFHQPSASAVTLNRVLDSNPSQIFGSIRANGQVLITNPNGVYFSPTASVDVGGLVATTHRICFDDFMAGRIKFERNGVTAGVVNEGELVARLGGYIALLAPEVRNRGVIIASLGIVALAAGESFELQFDANNTLAGLRVAPATIKTLVENHSAVLAPGGLIILSAQAVDRIQGGVVRNSGTLEATGLALRGGRMVLEASSRIENSGRIDVGATASGPAGRIELSAPKIVNSGTVAAAGHTVQSVGGDIRIAAADLTQSATGTLEASGLAMGGSLSIAASGTVTLAGRISTAATVTTADASADRAADESAATKQGGDIGIGAAQIVFDGALLDASGDRGGRIRIEAFEPNPAAPPAPVPAPSPGKLALHGATQVSVRGRRGAGGAITLLGEHIELNDTTTLDASGATGGGTALVGGGWQGGGGLRQATAVTMEEGATIDVSAIHNGVGGTAVLWSDVNNPASTTLAKGSIFARGGREGGDGGRIETSGATLNIGAQLAIDAGAGPVGRAGSWLLDPYNYTIGETQASTITSALNTTDVTVDTSLNHADYGSSGSSGDAGNISVNSAIAKTGATGTTLTLNAANQIDIAAGIGTSGGDLNLVLNAGGGSGSVSGVLALGGGTLTKSGSGTLTLSGANTYTGAVTISAGTLAVTNAAGLGTTAGGATIASGATLDIQNVAIGAEAIALNGGTLLNSNGTSSFAGTITLGADSTITAGAGIQLTLSGAIGGSFGFTKTGTGMLTLSGNNTYEGTTTIPSFSGVVKIQSNNALGSTAGGTTVGYSSAIQIDGDGLVVPETISGLQYTGVSSDGALRNLQGSNTWSGNIVVSVNADEGYSPYHTYIASDSGTLTISGNISNKTAEIAEPLYFLGNGNVSVSGIISIGTGSSGSTAGTLTKQGNGTLALSGANTYGGGTTVSAGTLTIGNTTAAGSGTLTNDAAVNVASGVTAVTLGGLAGWGTVSLTNLTAGNAVALTVGANNANTTYSGTLTGSGSFTKAGTGTLKLSGASTYTGLTTISAGTLKLGAAGGGTNTPLGTVAAGTVVSSDAALDLNGFTLGTAEALTINGTGVTSGGALTNTSTTAAIYSGLLTLGSASSIVASSGNIVLSHAGTITGDYALTLGGTNSASSLASIIGTGAGNVTKVGAGTWTVSGASTYTGLTTISAGTLKLGAGGGGTNTPLGTVAAGTVVSSNAALDLNGHTLGTAEALTISGTGVISGGALTNTSATSATYSGLLTLGSASSIVASSGNIVLSNAGPITGPGYGLTLGGSNTASSLASIIGTGAGTVTKAGAGTWTLSGASTYTGVTAVNAGVLNLRHNTAAGTADGGVTVASGAALELQDNITVGAEALNLAGAGINSNGVLRNISGTNTYGGAVTLAANSVINAGAGTLTLSGAINGGQGLTIGGAGAVTVSGVVGGSIALASLTATATLAVNGGAVTTAGAQAYGGATSFGAVTTLQTTNSNISGAGAVTAPHKVTFVAGSGNVQFQNSANAFSASAVEVTSATNVDFVNANAMTVSDVSATGTVSIATLSGNLTVSGAITTTNTSEAAIALNAGQSTAAGIATGGDIVISGGTVSTGSGGRATLYTGSVSGSTGLTSLVGSGSGRFRYNSDESATNYTPTTLGSGAYAIYREQPTLTVTADDKTVIYGTAPILSATVSAYQNADTLAQSVSSAASVAVGGGISTSGNYNAGSHVLTPSGATSGLGYGFAYAVGSLTVNAKTLAATYTGVNKVYDRTTDASVTTSDNRVENDSLTINRSAAFADKNVGAGKAVTVSSVSLTGTDAGNYAVSATGSTTANITAKALTLTGLEAANKVYDGKTTATVSNAGSLSGVIAGDSGTVTFSNTGASFADKNVGEGKTVTLAGITLGGADAANYSIGSTATDTADISGRTLNVNYSGVDKIYDRTADASVTTSDDRVTNDVFTINRSAAFADKNVGAGKAVTVSSVNLTGTDATNYTVLATGSTTANITAKALTLTGFDAANKVYDGNTTATVSNAGSLSGVIAGDTVTVSNTGALFVDKNVGEGKTVTLAGVALSGDDVANYSIASTATDTANITAKTVTLSAAKTYDGTTGLTGAVTIGTGVGSETLTYTSATANDAHVVTANKYINAITLADNSGVLASNYALPELINANAPVTINAKTLTPSASITASAKTYDGTKLATGSTVSGSVSGLVGSDTYTLDTSGVVLAFSDAHVVTANKTVARAGGNITLGTLTSTGGGDFTGSSAGNLVVSAASDYVLGAQPTITPVASIINTATLTPKLTNTGVTKTYDKTTAAPAGFGPTYSFSGLVSGDKSATLASTSSVYNSKDVTVADKVTVSGLSITSITGDKSSASTDYVLDSTIKDVAAVITRKTVTLSGSKTYDGTTSLGGAVTLGTGIDGESLSYTGASANDAHVATTNKYVNAITLADNSGVLASNYALPEFNVAKAPVTINAKTLTPSASITAAAKTYDGTKLATGSTVSGSVSGLVGTDTYTLNTGGVVIAFSDAHVVGGKTIARTTGDVALGTLTSTGSGDFTGSSAGNLVVSAASDYVLGAQPTIAAVAGTINAKALTASMTAPDKVYDGTTTASPTFTITAGLVGSEIVTATGTATFNSKDVATASTVTATGNMLADGANGGLALNYSLASGQSDASVITAKALTQSGLSVAASKTYDGNTTATVIGTSALLAAQAPGAGTTADGKPYAGDTVGLIGTSTATYNTKNVTTADTVTFGGLSLTGAQAGNYALTAHATQAATITQRALNLTGFDAANKTYDGNNTATITNAGSLSGVISGDTVTVSNTGATFADKDVAMGKTVTLAGVSLAGTDATNYSIAATATDTADITAASKATSPSTPAIPVVTVPVIVTDHQVGPLLGEIRGATGAFPQPDQPVLALPPVVSAVPAPVSATTPVSSSGPGALPATPTAGLGNLQVSVVQALAARQDAFITVSVPKIAIEGGGFDFPLPAEFAEAIPGQAAVEVTTMQGEPLPSWLRYSPESRYFSASEVPDGALPRPLVVSAGQVRAVVVIFERERYR